MTATVLTHPRFAPTHRTVHLVHLDGRPFASAGFPCNVRDAGAPWAWIQETVAHEQGVREDDVGCIEPDNDAEQQGDLVTVDGFPVYRVLISH
jgi:hypothetical protein